MDEVAPGTKVFDAPPVRGKWRRLDTPDDVLALMDTIAEGVVACVADADRLDWTVPRDSLDLYDGIATLDKMPDVAADETIPYYTPIPEPEQSP